MVNDEKHTDVVAVTVDDHKHKHNTTTSRYAPQHARRRAISATIVVLLLLVGITALVLWIVYRPQNPKFTVVGAFVYGVNTVSPPSITAVQLTIVTRNPNDRVSIYYDHLAAYLSYKNQAITPSLMLPPLHHHRDSTVVMTPIWPVSQAVVNGLETDEVGAVSLRLVLTGKLRWKAGDIIKTGRKGVYVGCDVLVGLKRGALGPVPLVGSSVCKVDV